MTPQASMTATVTYCYSVRYITDDSGALRRDVQAWPVGGFQIDPSLQLIPLPTLKYKYGDDRPTSNEKRAARNQWKAKQADQLIRAVEALIALAPRIAERMRQLEQANQSDTEVPHE